MTDKVEVKPEDWLLAEEVVESERVIRTYASCEWAELSDDGKLWMATIVSEVGRISAERAANKAKEWLKAVLDGHSEYDTKLCCDGRECNCQGSTVFQAIEHYFAENVSAAGSDPLTAEAENERLREALKPFVAKFEKRREDYIRRYGSNPLIGANNFDAMPDAWPMENLEFCMGDFRRARQALGEAS